MRGPPSNPNGASVAVHMTDEDVIQRIAAMFGVGYTKPKSRKVHWKQTYRCWVRGARAVEWMIKLRPLMGRRRQGQIDRAIASYKRPEGWQRFEVKAMLPEMIVLRSKQFSFRQIALKLGCSHQRVAQLLRDSGPMCIG
jgi:hypothetical protein